jgi:hypothetical protein
MSEKSVGTGTLPALDGGQSVNTPLTPNSNSIAVASGDKNNTTNLSFLYNNMIPYWSPQVSAGNAQAILGTDVGNGVVTFKKGLTVSLISQQGYYIVTLDGQIQDTNSVYTITGKLLGTFPAPPAPK